MPSAYNEDLVVAASSVIGKLASRSAPDEPRVQLELILLGAVTHAIHTLKMPREEAFRSLTWLLGELKSASSEPTLTLVP
ncbi:MAG TPA: hypothetical protein VLE97_10785 [Gaiellaceae bacterium]|nr:hypothetical protein [Gaiellaceae bacterium]